MRAPKTVGKYSRFLAILCAVPGCAVDVDEHEGPIGSQREPVVYGTSQSTCDPHYDLTVGIGAPYNAVGYLNGCTAFLVDSDLVATAAHCLADPTDGSWMLDGSHPGFSRRFYPNFHPNRALADPSRVPRAEVTSYIVGTRTNIDGGHPVEPAGANDWGLARVANWQDVAGVNLTPLPLTTAQSYVDDVVTSPGYPRHWFPLSEMTPDSACGYYAVPYGALPTGETFECQRRWARGIVRHGGVFNPSCRVKGTIDLITHNCSNSGGNSGSPLVNYSQTAALGVTAGGGHNFDLSPPPVCTTDLSGGANYTVKAERFINVPRQASNVAVATRSNGAAATGIFAADFLKGRIRYRERSGTSPSFASPFSFWSDLGSVGTYPRSIAACIQTPSNPTPRAFAITGSAASGTTLMSQQAPFTSGWSDFTKPSGTTVLSDVDVAGEVSTGRCQVYLLANYDVYTKWMTSETTWSSGWARITTAANYVKVTAQKVDNVIFLFMLDAAGRLWWTRYTGSWSTPSQLAFPPGISAWTDVDLGYNSVPNSLVHAYSSSGSGNWSKVWTRVVYSNGTFGSWTAKNTTLYAKGTADGAAPPLTSITASRWLESGSPVTANLFGTDSQGNVYVLASETDTRWKSFYSQYLPTL